MVDARESDANIRLPSLSGYTAGKENSRQAGKLPALRRIVQQHDLPVLRYRAARGRPTERHSDTEL
jgi:hypothetical protein